MNQFGNINGLQPTNMQNLLPQSQPTNTAGVPGSGQPTPTTTPALPSLPQQFQYPGNRPSNHLQNFNFNNFPAAGNTATTARAQLNKDTTNFQNLNALNKSYLNPAQAAAAGAAAGAAAA